MSHLVTFTHGIGDFKEQSEYWNTTHAKLSELFPEAKVASLSYEQFLDRKPVSIAVSMAAAAASAKYAGTPGLGKTLADYGTDIFEYYLGRKFTRQPITSLMLSRLVEELNEIGGTGPIDLTLVGHSLGTLVTLRTLTVVAGPLTDADIKRIGLTADDMSKVQSIRSKIGKLDAILVASPAFSELRLIKLLTKKLALKETPVSTLLTNFKGSIVNLHSLIDPVSGPAKLAGINDINAPGVTHSKVAAYLDAYKATFSGQ